MGSNWRRGIRFAWLELDRAPDEGPRPDLAATHPGHWSGSWNTKIHGTITRDGNGWVAYLRLEDPPGLSPTTTVGRFATVEAARVATDEVWVAR